MLLNALELTWLWPEQGEEAARPQKGASERMLYTVGANAAQSSCIPLKAQLVQLLGFNRLAEAGVVLKELKHPLPLDIFLHNISLSSLTSAQDTFYGHKPLIFFF